MIWCMCQGPGSASIRRRRPELGTTTTFHLLRSTWTPGQVSLTGVYSPRLSMSTVVGSRVRFQILRVHLKKPNPTTPELILHSALSMQVGVEGRTWVPCSMFLLVRHKSKVQSEPPGLVLTMG